MTVTAPVSLTKIKTEFGGPDNLAAYTRGGTYVPNISANNAISTTAAGLAISQFLNAVNVAVNITDVSALNYSLNGVGGTATATYRLGSNGQARSTNNSGVLTDISGEWLVTGTASDFEVYATWSPQGGGPGDITGGGNVGGDATATWLSLGTTRDFTLTATNNAVERELYIQIRYTPTSTVLDSATIYVSVDSAP